MRTISKRTQYGLKAVLNLASHYGEGPVLISSISETEGIPVRFLELILLHLKNRGLLHSKKGKGGGYELSRPPSTVTIGSLIRIMEGPLAPLPAKRPSNPAPSALMSKDVVFASSCGRCATLWLRSWTGPRLPIFCGRWETHGRRSRRF
jgi:Rrf2 family protein